jgi:AraC family L-rhamnose operon regulatory protein RhaS
MHEDGAKIKWVNRRISTHHVVIGEVLYQPGGFAGPRRQESYELMLLFSGSCRATVDKQTMELRPDTVYLFHPGHRETLHFSEQNETHQCWCKVEPARLPAEVRRALAKTAIAAPATGIFKRLLSTALELRASGNLAVSWEVDSLAVALFAEYLNSVLNFKASGRVDDPVDIAVRHMHDYLAEESCLLEAHKAAGVSRNTLINQFQKRHHTSPSRYLWKLRTERGIAMIVETGLRVSEIAYQCGFKNPFHFSRQVKLLQGTSPRQFRQRVWNAVEK